MPSRSAAVQFAVRQLRRQGLEQAYADAAASRSGRGVVTVVPLTTSTARVWPFQVLLPAEETGLDPDSKAQAEQVRSVAVERVGAALGRVVGVRLAEVDEALRLHLAL